MQPIDSILTDSPRVEAVYGEPFSEYQAAVGMNASTLKAGRASPRHLLAAWNAPHKDSDAMRWGRAVHTMLETPRLFEEQVRVWSGGNKVKAKKAWAEFKQQCADDGADWLDEEGPWSYRAVLDAMNVWLNDPLVMASVRGSRPEVCLFWNEGEVQCKARTDMLREDKIVDVKTAASIEARPFAQSFYRLGYDMQLGMYQRAVEQVLGRLLPVEIICIENKPPYDVAVVPVHDSVLERGWAKVEPLLKRLPECIRSGVWPGIANGQLYPLDVPAWEMNDPEEEFAQGEYA
jgi:hypothetical protein